MRGSAVHALDVFSSTAALGAEGDRQRDSRRVARAAAEGEDLLVFVHAPVACHHWHAAGIEFLAHAVGFYAGDAALVVPSLGNDARLLTSQPDRFLAERLQGHRHQRD